MARKVIGVASNVVGRARAIQRRWAVLLSLIVIVGAGLFFVRTVLAVHNTGYFELDGNATSALSGTSADWDRVCHEVDPTACTNATPSGATAVSWVAEPNPSASIFTGGGSKDPIDLNQWAWKDAGGLPDKDNLTHSFAARYSLTAGANCPSGSADPTVPCEILFFGSDRFDNSGDAQQGFWFFQNKIQLTNIKSGGGFAFSGVHHLGDLLIISDFSNGGTTSTISVYTWDPSVSGNLKLLATSDAANCGVVGPNDQFCGLVNAAVTTSPWAFTDKSGNHSFLNGEFYEGGVNLSLLGLAGECFSSVASETRSSTSTTATLKDFVLGQFANCVPGMTTQASATVASPVTPGTAVHDTATITVTGGSNPPDPTGTVTFFLCGPIATGDCSSGGTNIGTGLLAGGANTTDGVATAQSPDVNTAASNLASGRYCFRAEWPGDANYSAISHTDSTLECFAVKDTSSLTTTQNWLPNDSASVTTGSGNAASGSVTFTLYASANCTGTVLGTFANIQVANGTASTNNTTTYISSTTISWRAVFTPSDPNAVGGSSSSCETSTLTITN
jgi:hypothetical protein